MQSLRRNVSRSVSRKSVLLGGKSARSYWIPSNLVVTLYNPDGEDVQDAIITWKKHPTRETELYRSLDRGAYALLTTIAPNTGEYVDHLFDGETHTVDYKARFKEDTTVLNVPTGLTLVKIAGGIRIIWDDNNTEAEKIQVAINVDSAGYNIIEVNAGVEVYEYASAGLIFDVKVRAKEGTLPVYSGYTAVSTIDVGIYDQDGNGYHEVVIGTQTWLIENFRSTKYKDGSAIPVLGNAAARAADVTGAMDWYNGDVNNKAIYGGLYNAYAVNNAKGLGINGYHIPTDAEWTTLNNYLGTGPATKMAEAGLTGWANNWGSNTSGWTARGGGWSNAASGAWEYLKSFGFWHTSNGTHRHIQTTVTTLGAAARGNGCFASVRLIKD